uniref:Delta-like protein n=1 Tax=Macrostomum lignano TaxID=282301 RepID=A0A1I8JAA5_9PLAT
VPYSFLFCTVWKAIRNIRGFVHLIFLRLKFDFSLKNVLNQESEQARLFSLLFLKFPVNFTGTDCEINIDDCASKPCANGLCSDLVNDYSCSCFTGWEGRNCNINHNDCPTGACLNGGRCIDSNGTFTCDCTDTGFTGDRCQKNIDDCASKPCINGLCTDLVKNYSCSCFTGWRAGAAQWTLTTACQGPILTSSAQALRFQSAFSNPKSVLPATALASTFKAPPCSSRIDDCASSPCQHGGRCTDGVRSFTCGCLPGYEGPTCSVDINECERFGQPCQNGAVCKDLVADYACTGCPAEFGGKNCSVLLPQYSFGISGLVSSASFASLPNASRVSGGDSWTIELRLVTLSRGAFLLLLGDPSDSATTPRLLATIAAMFRSAYCLWQLRRCKCHNGYSGVNCSVDHPDCSPNPCKSGEVCLERSDQANYKLRFLPWPFNGRAACSEGDCKNGGVCWPGAVTSSTPPCLCTEAYTGFYCTDRINYCTTTSGNPCQNGGTCSNTDTSPWYHCSCVPGYTGTDCEINIDDCASKPCANAVCSDLVNDYSCSCFTGWEGRNCSVDTDYCLSGPCQNSGVCSDGNSTFTCDCSRVDFQGVTCSSKIDDCASSPCQHGGRCTDGVRSFSCDCLPGYEGPTCSVDINECERFGQPCQNGAVCKAPALRSLLHIKLLNFQSSLGPALQSVENGLSSTKIMLSWCSLQHLVLLIFVHQAVAASVSHDRRPDGTDCEINIDDCASKPCINGLCSDLVNDYSCSCFTGWEGRSCSFNHNDCPTSACLNGGRCIDGNGTFTCDCTDTGFAGDRCQINIDDCASKPCANGLCTDLLKNYSCSCFTGWEGRSCSVDTDYCLSGPCQNGGVCSDGNSTFTCDCSRIDFQGATCSSKIDDCASSPCQHGGRCIDGVRSFTCDCTDTGFTGDRCQINIDDCASGPCANGLCTDLVKNYSCSCFTGWEGRSCSVDTDYCLSGPCQNGGVCSDGNSTFTCDCSRVDFQGDTCSSKIDDCASSPCQHGGRCIDGVRDFTCDCSATDFNGPNCQSRIDDCASNPCSHNATCTDRLRDFSCSCFSGYSGKTCSDDVPDCSPNPCQFGAACVERSNQDLYGNSSLPSPFNESFSYALAAGFVCLCPHDQPERLSGSGHQPQRVRSRVELHGRPGLIHLPLPAGYEGPTCSVDINECERFGQPCQNGAVCKDLVADYACTGCPAEFGGKNCSVRLTGCDSSPCQMNEKCKPLLLRELPSPAHGYRCTCKPGWSGPQCNETTLASFSGSTAFSVLLDNTNSSKTADCTFELSFRTSLAHFDLVRLSSHWGDIRVGAHDSSLVLLFFNASSSVIGRAAWPISDSLASTDWLTLSVSLTNGSATLSRSESGVSQLPGAQLVDGLSDSFKPNSRMSVRVGGESGSGIDGGGFRGCVRDLRLVTNDSTLVATETTAESSNATWGVCSRSVQCGSPSPCEAKTSSMCSDVWNDFVCHCTEDFGGRRCSVELPSFSLGVGGSVSSAIFASAAGVSSVYGGDSWTIELRLVTLSRGAFLLLLGDPSDSATTPRLLATSIKNSTGHIAIHRHPPTHRVASRGRLLVRLIAAVRRVRKGRLQEALSVRDWQDPRPQTIHIHPAGPAVLDLSNFDYQIPLRQHLPARLPVRRQLGAPQLDAQQDLVSRTERAQLPGRPVVAALLLASRLHQMLLDKLSNSQQVALELVGVGAHVIESPGLLADDRQARIAPADWQFSEWRAGPRARFLLLTDRTTLAVLHDVFSHAGPVGGQFQCAVAFLGSEMTSQTFVSVGQKLLSKPRWHHWNLPQAVRLLPDSAELLQWSCSPSGCNFCVLVHRLNHLAELRCTLAAVACLSWDFVRMLDSTSEHWLPVSNSAFTLLPSSLHSHCDSRSGATLHPSKIPPTVSAGLEAAAAGPAIDHSGRLSAQLLHGNGSLIAALTSSDSVATGSFVSVKISVSISGRSLSLSVSSSVSSASLSSASPLPQLSGQLIIGGFSGASPPSTGGRSKRSLPVFPASIWAAMPSGVTGFRGIISHPRLNEARPLILSSSPFYLALSGAVAASESSGVVLSSSLDICEVYLPCRNGGTCTSSKASCVCHPGYSGTDCSVDNSECSPNPCGSDEVCLERSHSANYNHETLPWPFNGSFKYKTADGYLCLKSHASSECSTGFVGSIGFYSILVVVSVTLSSAFTCGIVIFIVRYRSQLSVGGQPTEAAESPYAGVYETSTDDHTYDNLSNNSAKFSSIQLA